MTKYKRQNVVLVDFDFTQGTGSKKRPVLIISGDSYHKNRQEVIVAAITGNTKRVLFGDTKIDKWKEAGLICPSLVTGIIRTIKSNMIIRKLGMLLPLDFQKAQKNIRKTMEF
jgi:mRNA interferase MazF